MCLGDGGLYDNYYHYIYKLYILGKLTEIWLHGLWFILSTQVTL
jgi:hypothetical protein